MEVYRIIYMVLCVVLMSTICNTQHANSALLSKETKKLIEEVNENGPYLGLVIPNLFELNPLLASPDYTASIVLDLYGRRFRFGSIGDKRVILVMTGLSMINAAITTQLLLTLFFIEGVVHYGIAGNANPSYDIGDVVIPQYWAHSALWSWQRYGLGPEDELPLEASGDYTREIGFMNFANYTVVEKNNGISLDNLLNNIWYQPEEVFPVDGTPEERQHSFWVPVDSHYYAISETLKDLELEACVNATKCLPKQPKVYRVERGTSASIYLDNSAYRGFIYEKFNITPVDMESASVALICLQNRAPFIAIRALSDLAGGGSAESNEADIFINLAAANSITAVVAFVKSLSAHAATARFSN